MRLVRRTTFHTLIYTGAHNEIIAAAPLTGFVHLWRFVSR
jgi:hypothetical protein